MSTGTGIEWTDATWNPTSGCTHASPGCDHCYAKTMTYRLESMGQEKYRGLTVLNPRGDRHFNGVMRTDEDALTIPLKWRKPRRVFVNSMSDLFHKDVPFEFIDKVFAVMALTPHHTYQVLTKRPERMAEYLDRGINEIITNVLVSEKDERAGTKSPMDEIRNRVALLERITTREFTENHFTNEDMKEPVKLDHWPPPWPLPNVWLGTSVENQEWSDKRIPHLLRCPAAVRFLSCEPMLGELKTLERWLYPLVSGPEGGPEIIERPRIDWVIVGGESGAGARPCNIEWIRSIVKQCKAAGVACFVKQLGKTITIRNDSCSEWPRDGDGLITDADYEPSYQGELMEAGLVHPKGGDQSEWPEDLRVREFPKVTA